MRPLPREATASYLTRLATAYHLSAVQLLDGLHITATGTPTGPPATDIHLSNEAARRLSHFTRIPPAHLPRTAPPAPPAAIATAHAATARWHTVEPAMQPLPACTACTIHRSPHTAAPAWIHPAPNLPRALICTRHQQASSDPRQHTPLDIRPAPELTRTHLGPRRRPTPASLSWASTITTRWDDHHQHLHQRWHTRLRRLPRRQPPPRLRPGLPHPDLPQPDHLPRDPHPRRSPRPPAAIPPDPHPADRLPPRPRRPPPPAPPRTRRPRPALATPHHPLKTPAPASHPPAHRPTTRPTYRRANHTAQKPPPHPTHCATPNNQLNPHIHRPRTLGFAETSPTEQTHRSTQMSNSRPQPRSLSTCVSYATPSLRSNRSTGPWTAHSRRPPNS